MAKCVLAGLAGPSVRIWRRAADSGWIGRGGDACSLHHCFFGVARVNDMEWREMYDSAVNYELMDPLLELIVRLAALRLDKKL